MGVSASHPRRPRRPSRPGAPRGPERPGGGGRTSDPGSPDDLPDGLPDDLPTDGLPDQVPAIGVPLLLLPVRIETVFRRRGKGPDRLFVRVAPDTIHADLHQSDLQDGEREAGRRFWALAGKSGIARAELDAVFARLAARVGPFRAVWVLEATRPEPGPKAAAPLPPPPQPSAVARGRARLLPDYWLVTGYQRNERLFSVRGNAIPPDLPLAPELAPLLAAGPAPRTILDLLDAQGLTWVHDLAAAEQVGMAVQIDLPPTWHPLSGLDLYVTGRRAQADPHAEADAVAELLAAHQWTHGLDFLRRGMPTNTTTDGATGVSLSAPDLVALLDSVLGTTSDAPPPRGPVGPAPGGREAPDLPDRPVIRWHQRTFAEATAAALGLGPSVLDRVPTADDEQLSLGPAMNAALWPAAWGYLLRDLLPGVVPAEDVSWLRERFVHDVPAGGVLPTVRCGRQPYGVLPVLAGRQGGEDTLGAVLDELRWVWDNAVASVARLDPDVTDRPGDAGGPRLSLEEASTRLARIVGATPNPSDLALRGVRDDSELFAQAWGVAVIVLAILLSVAPDVAGELGEQMAGAATLEALIDVLDDTIHGGWPASGAVWTLANSASSSPEVAAAAQAAIDFISAALLNGGPLVTTGADGQTTTTITAPLLTNHLTRISPVLGLEPDREQVTGLFDDDAPSLFGSLFDETATGWTGPLVGATDAADGTDAGDAQDDATEPATWLAALLAELNDPERPASPPGLHPPLLFQLLQHAVRSVHPPDVAALRWGLGLLAEAAAGGRMQDPVADLETLMGETLGACMHRIDAWYAGYAMAELEGLRRLRPEGLVVGGYGVVLGLRPRPDGAGLTQGFVHAPSADLAATAAILRSGWSALGGGAAGGGSEGGGLALDLSSGAVRAASWIVDGVRDGQRLGHVLGRSVERRLHDAGLDVHIAPLRRLVLDAGGQTRRPARAIVDGYLLARAWLGADQVSALTELEQDVAHALLPYAAAVPGLDDVLGAHARDLDAVADTAVAQAVHALVCGQPQVASATLDGVSGGDAGPVALSAFRTERGGQRVSHRLVLVIDPAAEPVSPDTGSDTSPAAQAEPALDSWLARALPLDRVVYGARVTQGGVSTTTGPWTLAETGLTPLELLAELPDGPDLGTGRLHDRLAWATRLEAAAAGRQVEVAIEADPPAPGADDIPLRLFLPAAQAVRSLLRAGRAATTADLDTAGTTDAESGDLTELATRARGLVARARADAEALRTARDSDAPTAQLLTASAALARWQITDAVHGAGLADLAHAGAGGDPADRQALLAQAGTTLAALDARLAAHDAVTGEDLAATTARIAAVLPGVPVLPLLTPPPSLTDGAEPARSAARLGGPAGAVRWLQQVGRVREASSIAASAVELVEAAGGLPWRPHLVQLPDHPSEGWAAVTRPSVDDRPRTCLLALAWPEVLGPQVAALVVDAWTEVIPDQRTRTGLAVHVDAPSARAPQLLLLGVPDGEWTDASVRTLVLDTVDDARRRAVGPQDLQGWGQFLPAVHLGADPDPGPPTVELARRGSV